jgi:hypothetical protein
VATEVFEGATAVNTVLQAADELFVGDVNYCRTLVEKAAHVLAERLALLLLEHRQVHATTRASHGTLEVFGELCLQLVPLVDRVLV